MRPSGPTRCVRCHAYHNPTDTFLNGGKSYRCSFCAFINDVPPDSYSPLSPSGQPFDIMNRPELLKGTVEYFATKEYCFRPPTPIHYLFVIEVSQSSILSIIPSVTQAIKQVLANSPQVSYVRIGIITYDTCVHFYDLKSNVKQPQMLVVPDLESMYLPTENIFVNYTDGKLAVDFILDNLPAMFSSSTINKTAFGSALKAAHLALKPTGGKMIVFNQHLPSNGPGSLHTRYINSNSIVTDKEFLLFQPQSCLDKPQFYPEFGKVCAVDNVSVDLFLFPKSFVDVSTLGTLCKLTCGQVYYYEMFSRGRDYLTFYHNLQNNIDRTIGYDAIMRVRCSLGLTVEEYQGSLFVPKDSFDVQLACVDTEKSFNVLIKHDDRIDDKEAVIQCAILYTTAKGERRIRIHTLGLQTTPSLPIVYKNAYIDMILYSIVLSGIIDAREKPLAVVRQNLQEKSINILYGYRKHCVTNASGSHLVLPDSLKLLPLYSQALLKNSLFLSSFGVSPDLRSHLYFLFSGCLPYTPLITFIYPRLYSFYDQQFTSLRLGKETLLNEGVFFLTTGLEIFIWVSSLVPPETLALLFGVYSFHALSEQFPLQPLSNPWSERIHSIVQRLRLETKEYVPVNIVKQNDPLSEPRFLSYLVEDRNNETPDYSEYLVTLHRTIQQKISSSQTAELSNAMMFSETY
eukprot:TRINITY_DN4140_c0_g1_i1.p1 TRINITY_DN4140_c0_g1~~TRINITY_DN4140_c0_g1_i1.p1  ORF type:complete len:793 (+),score=102.92 TRINITY_DN4140_c0_g1_i1:329-2380(+)